LLHFHINKSHNASIAYLHLLPHQGTWLWIFIVLAPLETAGSQLLCRNLAQVISTKSNCTPLLAWANLIYIEGNLMVRNNKTSLRHFIPVAEVQVVLEDDATFGFRQSSKTLKVGKKLVILTSTSLFQF
jgi:hypothetical protein